MVDLLKGGFVFNHLEWKTPNTYNSNYSSVTENSGVYVFTSTTFEENRLNFEILYVGSAKNLKQRYKNHEVKKILCEIYNYIQFYFVEEKNYREIEKTLIKTMQPKFNKQWR